MTKHWDLINTCFSSHHLYFADDPGETLWMSAGGPGLGGGIVGWLDTRQFRKTGDAVASQGWTPLVIDTNGNGRRDAYVEAEDPLDPAKDKRIAASFYGIMPSPVNTSIWGESMDRGFSRIDQPGYLVRVVPGPDPAAAALAEIYQPPDGSFGPRGIDIGLDGVVWTALSSGHLRARPPALQGALNGPTTAEGQQCPEGWKLYRMPGPQFRGLDPAGGANHAYYVWVDRYNVLGLGANVPIAEANGGESLLALVNGEFVTFGCRIRSASSPRMSMAGSTIPAAGWKGRGLWTTSGTRANFHGEGGKEGLSESVQGATPPRPAGALRRATAVAVRDNQGGDAGVDQDEVSAPRRAIP